MNSRSNKLLAIVMSSMILFSCANNGDNTTVYHEGTRDNITNVTDKIIPIDDKLPDMHANTGVFVAGDTLLFDDSQATDLVFTAYDILGDRTVGRFGKFGNGPGEIANFGAMFYVNDEKILYGVNANQGKIVGFYLPEAIANPDYDAVEKIKMDFNNGNNAILNPDYENDSTIICTVYKSDEETRSMVSHIGNLDLTTRTVTVIDSLPSGMKARSGIAVSRKHNIIFAADKQQDFVRIFDLGARLKSTVYGPDYDEKTDRKKWYYSAVVICGDYVAALYSPGDTEPKKDIVVMDLDGRYLKTLRLDFGVNSIAYHEKTGRLYLSTYGDPQFGYLEFDRLMNGTDTGDTTNSKSSEASKSSESSEVSVTLESSVTSESEKKIVEEQSSTAEPAPVKCLTSDKDAIRALNHHKGESDSGPLALVDLNTQRLDPVNHLDVGAYKESNGMYLYTIGIVNPDESEAVKLESIAVPDDYFTMEWPSNNPVSPQAAGFLRLWCKEPVKKDYSIVLKYADGKYPPQALSLTLHPSGAQLYNEMQNKK